MQAIFQKPSLCSQIIGKLQNRKSFETNKIIKAVHNKLAPLKYNIKIQQKMELDKILHQIQKKKIKNRQQKNKKNHENKQNFNNLTFSAKLLLQNQVNQKIAKSFDKSPKNYSGHLSLNQFDNNRLPSIVQCLERRKNNFLNKISNEMIGFTKKNINFEYMMNVLQQMKKNDMKNQQDIPRSGYDKISPNKLKIFMEELKNGNYKKQQQINDEDDSNDLFNLNRLAEFTEIHSKEKKSKSKNNERTFHIALPQSNIIKSNNRNSFSHHFEPTFNKIIIKSPQKCNVKRKNNYPISNQIEPEQAQISDEKILMQIEDQTSKRKRNQFNVKIKLRANHRKLITIYLQKKSKAKKKQSE